MKNLLIMIAVAAFISLNACGQNGKNVPASVKTAFSQKFPNATKVKWGKENDTEWEAEFKMDGKEYSANFDVNGNWMETEYEINESEIPQEVKATLDNEFAGCKISETEISETADGKVYEIQIKKDGKKSEVSIDMNGKVLSKEEGKEGDEDDED